MEGAEPAASDRANIGPLGPRSHTFSSTFPSWAVFSTVAHLTSRLKVLESVSAALVSRRRQTGVVLSLDLFNDLVQGRLFSPPLLSSSASLLLVPPMKSHSLHHLVDVQSHFLLSCEHAWVSTLVTDGGLLLFLHPSAGQNLLI